LINQQGGKAVGLTGQELLSSGQKSCRKERYQQGEMLDMVSSARSKL
jgi:hypothetical protein